MKWDNGLETSKMRLDFKGFIGSSSGSFVPIVALCLVPLVLSVGMATDYAMGVRSENSMQNALDAAALSLTTMPQSATDSDRQQMLQTMYASNGGEGTATLESATFDPDGTLHVSAKANYSLPTNFMKLARIDQVPIAVATGIVKKPTLVQATFKITKASGYWNKTMTLYGTKFGATTAVPLMQITYTYNGAGGAKGYGTTTVQTPNSNGQFKTNKNVKQQQVCTSTTYNPWKPIPSGSFVDGNLLTTCNFTVGGSSGGTGAAIDVSQMQDLYLEMDVPQGYPSVLKSNDPNTSDRLYLNVQYDNNGNAISADEVAAGTTVDIFTAVPCGQTSNQAWEDGGNAVPAPVSNADFFYSVTGKCDYTQRVANTRFTQ
jgi:Flp pilus assembly protein TadG